MTSPGEPPRLPGGDAHHQEGREGRLRWADRPPEPQSVVSFGERVSADVIRDLDMRSSWITQVTLNLPSIVVRDALKGTNGAGGGGHGTEEEVGGGARAQAGGAGGGRRVTP